MDNHPLKNKINIVVSETTNNRAYLTNKLSDILAVFFNEKKDSLHVEIELSGLRQKNIEVKVEKEFLKVSYTPHVAIRNTIEQKSIIMCDRLIKLPDNIDKDRFTIYFNQNQILLIFPMVSNNESFNMYY